MNNLTESLKFYTDKHIPKAVALQLRARGIDVVRCEEVGLGDVADDVHLEYAVKNQRTVITHDQDFLRLSNQWLSEGKDHYGIMFCSKFIHGNDHVGIVVKICVEYFELIAGGAGTIKDDMMNQVIFVS